MPASRRNPSVHPLVAALNPDPAQPPRRTVKLVGLLGQSPSSGHTRLWLDEDLTSYVDIPTEAIAHSRELPDDAGSILWVDAGATLTHGSVTTHEAQADFLSGSIASGHLTGAAGPAASARPPAQAFGPIQTTSFVCPSFIHICPTPTAVTCPSIHLACPTANATCPSVHTFCPTPTAVTCPSIHLACPTNVTCPSVHTFCPTPTAVTCPSVHIPCQVPTGVGCPTIGGCPQPSIACGGEGEGLQPRSRR